jgi:hypothetical protein
MITIFNLGLNQKNLSLIVDQLDVNENSPVKEGLGKIGTENKIISALTNNALHKLFSPIGDLTPSGL